MKFPILTSLFGTSSSTEYFSILEGIQYKEIIARLDRSSGPDKVVFVGQVNFYSNGEIKLINCNHFSGTWDLPNYRKDDTYSEGRNVYSWGFFAKSKKIKLLRIKIFQGVLTFENKYSNNKISKKDQIRIVEWLKFHHKDKKRIIGKKDGTWLDDAI